MKLTKQMLKSTIALVMVIMLSFSGCLSITDANAKTAKPTFSVKASVDSVTITGLNSKASTSIYRSTSKSGSFKLIKTVKAASYVDSKLTKGKTYYYKIKVKTATSTSKMSAVVTAKLKSDIPFTYKSTSSGIVLTKYTGTAANPTIPTTVGGKKVVEIGESCFAGNLSITKVKIPEGIKGIGKYAFECCSSITKVYTPDSLEFIGDGAFSGCVSIRFMDLGDKIEHIGKGAFLYNQKLVYVTIPASVKNVGTYAFAGCQNLSRVTFDGESIANLSDRLFYDCENLSTIDLPKNVSNIGIRAFGKCRSIKYLYFANKLDSISEYAFQDCGQLSSVQYEADKVADTAFSGCYSLPSDEDEVPAEESTEVTEEPTVTDNISDTTEVANVDDTTTEVPAEVTSADATTETVVPKTGSYCGDKSLFDEAKFSKYITISNEEFPTWSEKYMKNNKDLSSDKMIYTMLYKGEVVPHYIAMVAVQTKEESSVAEAKALFGDDFEDMYLMMDHGLFTELKNGKMCDDLILYSGVYEDQMMYAAGTDTVPTIEQLANAVGREFTDPQMISTTTDITVASDFASYSNTIFIYYASKSALDKLGAISIDSMISTNENEILMSGDGKYKVLDAGVMPVETVDDEGNPKTVYRNYVKIEILGR